MSSNKRQLERLVEHRDAAASSRDRVQKQCDALRQDKRRLQRENDRLHQLVQDLSAELGTHRAKADEHTHLVHELQGALGKAVT